jgi:hypothetical protein
MPQPLNTRDRAIKQLKGGNRPETVAESLGVTMMTLRREYGAWMPAKAQCKSGLCGTCVVCAAREHFDEGGTFREFAEGDDPVTPAHIEACTAEIRSRWSEEEHERRFVGPSGIYELQLVSALSMRAGRASA